MRKLTRQITEWFNFFLERQFVKGTHIQLFFVVALIGIISLIGGILVIPTEDPSTPLGDSIWWAFLRLSDPGYLGDDEGTWRRIVSTLLTVAGYVVFMGSMVAIITSWLNRKIRTLEQGLTPVTANNHVVILGWTNRTVHIAAELFQSSKRVKKFLKRHGARVLKLIILSDDVTPFRLQVLKDNELIGKRAKEIILRSGESINREHLSRVDSMHASAIIIPTPAGTSSELITPDVETIKTLLSLNAETGSMNRSETLPYVVAEIQDENKVKAAQRAYNGPIEIISSDTIVSRLIAQNLHHDGLSVVFNELISHSYKSNLYAVDLPDAEGKTFDSIHKLFPKSILIGIVRVEDGEFIPYLNPSRVLVLEKSDRIILLADDMDDIEVTQESIKFISEQNPSIHIKVRPAVDYYSGSTNLLVLGWNHHIPSLIKELGTYKEENFNITLASLRPLASRNETISHIMADVKNITCKHIVTDYIRESDLRAVEPENFDHILLVSSDKLAADEEADARTIVGYTMLEEVLQSSEKRPHIVMELTNPNNEILIKNFRSETIISPLILSNLLATIAMRRELFCVYNELFTVGGGEIIFRNLSEYNLNLGTISSSELEKIVIQYQDTFLGIFNKSDNNQSILKLNIPRNHTVNLTENSRLVVLSTV